MNVYLHFGVRELAALNSTQRHLVWSGVARAHPYSFRVLPCLLYSAWMVLAVFLLVPVGQRLTGGFWGSLILANVTLLALFVLEHWVLTRRFRQDIRRYIKDHEAELRTVA